MVVLPSWGVDQKEYRDICSYLGLTPQSSIYIKLAEYLIAAPLRFETPTGFYGFLAAPRLTRFRVARLDVVSKLFCPKHPLRHILNTVIALHECDGKGYREMETVPEGRVAWISIINWMVGYCVSFLITMSWLGWQYMLYLVDSASRAKDSLRGKRVLITGVNGGLGTQLLLHALEQGATVIGTVRAQEAVREVTAQFPNGTPLQVIVADLSLPGSLKKSFFEAKLDPKTIDIAILCAGVKYPNKSALSIASLRETFEVNYFANVEFLNWMYKNGNSRKLVLVSSMGRWHGMKSTCGYNASKAALSIWAESFEMELRAEGRDRPEILIVEPGIFESGMMNKARLSRVMIVPAREVARRIIAAILAGKRTLRYPFWFAWMTWVLCLAGRNIRNRLLAAAK